MAYLRDDQKLSRYLALQRELKLANEEISSVSSEFATDLIRLYTLKRSLERRMDELKQDCHLLQR